MAWTDGRVKGLEAVWRLENAACDELERKVRETLKDLKTFCTEAGNTQKANDKALQDLHRELSQIAAAANQQQLAALFIEPSDGENGQSGRARTTRRKTSAGRALVRAGVDGELRSTIERAHARGNRFNVARIEAWITELEQALRLGEHAMINRGLAGLTVELTK